MDILIKNASLPKETPVKFTVFPNGATVVHWDGVVFEETNAVELKQHGRLIDADKLKEVLLKHGHPDTREWYYAEVAQFIDEAQTVLEGSE